MSYRILRPHLHSTADLVYAYLKSIGVKSLKIEQKFDQRVGYVPTIWGKKRFIIVAAEIRDLDLTEPLRAVVVPAIRGSIPVEFTIWIPEGTKEAISTQKVLQESGIGLAQIGDSGPHIFCNPLRLSLLGYEKPQKSQCPLWAMEDVERAERKYMQGAPEDACKELYDLCEALTKKIMEKLDNNGSYNRGSVDIQRDPWASLIDHGIKHINFTACPSSVNMELFKRLIPLPIDRNTFGHKPNSVKKREERDGTLKTQYGVGMNVLYKLFKAANALNIRIV